MNKSKAEDAFLYKSNIEEGAFKSKFDQTEEKNEEGTFVLVYPPLEKLQPPPKTKPMAPITPAKKLLLTSTLKDAEEVNGIINKEKEEKRVYPKVDVGKNAYLPPVEVDSIYVKTSEKNGQAYIDLDEGDYDEDELEFDQCEERQATQEMPKRTQKKKQKAALA